MGNPDSRYISGNLANGKMPLMSVERGPIATQNEVSPKWRIIAEAVMIKGTGV